MYTLKALIKYLLMITTALLLTTGMAFAQEKVGIVLEAPLEFCNDVKVHELIDNKTAQLFPKDRFNVMSTADSIAAVETYRKANNMNDVLNEGRGGYTKPMRMENIEGFGKQIGANYVLFFKLSNDAPKYGRNMIGATVKANIICETRVMNVAKGMYSINKQVVEKGKSTAVYAGIPSFKHAYLYAFTKGIGLLNFYLNAF